MTETQDKGTTILSTLAIEMGPEGNLLCSFLADLKPIQLQAHVAMFSNT